MLPRKECLDCRALDDLGQGRVVGNAVEFLVVQVVEPSLQRIGQQIFRALIVLFGLRTADLPCSDAPDAGRVIERMAVSERCLSQEPISLLRCPGVVAPRRAQARADEAWKR